MPEDTFFLSRRNLVAGAGLGLTADLMAEIAPASALTTQAAPQPPAATTRGPGPMTIFSPPWAPALR